MAGRLSELRAGMLLPPERFLVLISLRRSNDLRTIFQLERFQLKYPVTLSGMRLVAKCLNQLHHLVLQI
jgi:hypothetical protein